MRINASWKLAMSVLVAVCIVITQLEPRAFGKGTESSPGIVEAQNQNPAPPDAVPEPTPAPTKTQSGHRRFKKWMWIGIAAVGAAAVLLIKTRKTPEPVVTVGGPTVGNPQ